MTLYRWDSAERKFTPTSVRSDMPRGERVRQMRVGKGERIRAEVATGDLCIRVIEGAWRMQIALALADLNGDGKAEIVVGQNTANQVTVILGK